MGRLQSLAALAILHFLRWFFTRRRAVQETQKAARDGWIVGGHVQRRADSTPPSLTLFWVPDGGTPGDAVRLAVWELRYQKNIGWVFHE